jgi:hypothetical protein
MASRRFLSASVFCCWAVCWSRLLSDFVEREAVRLFCAVAVLRPRASSARLPRFLHRYKRARLRARRSAFESSVIAQGRVRQGCCVKSSAGVTNGGSTLAESAMGIPQCVCRILCFLRHTSPECPTAKSKLISSNPCSYYATKRFRLDRIGCTS